MFRNTIIAIVALLFFSLPAFADKCKDPIVDEVQAFSSEDTARVSSAINKLVLLGADPRVQILSSYHNTNSVDEYKAMFQAQCKSWQASDGGLKNNIVLLLVVPKKQSTGFYYGEQWRHFLSSGKVENSTDMNARFRDGKLADGVVVGLENVADLVSVKPSQAGKPVVINHPADYSGLWSFFKWSLFIVVVFGAGYVLWLVFRRKEDSRGAQRDAQTARAACVQYVNGYTTPLAVLKAKISGASVSADWKARLGDLLDQAQQAYTRASAEFNALSRSVNNPDTPRLSVSEYQKMQGRYEKVSAMFGTAQDAFEKTQTELRRAISGESISRASDGVMSSVKTPEQSAPVVQPPKTPRTSNYSSGGRGVGYRHHEDAVHHDSNSSTILIINNEDHHHDDSSWANQRVREPDVPVIVDPTEPKGDGVSTNWGTSGDGDGVSTTWGKSGDGDGVSSSWNDTKSSDDDGPSTSRWEGGQGTSY